MSLESRAAQFASFAALIGYDDEIRETARLTEENIELNEELKEILNKKINLIKIQIKNNPKVTIKYFIPDDKKAGGKYQSITKEVKKIDDYYKNIILTNGEKIPIQDIIDIEIV